MKVIRRPKARSSVFDRTGVIRITCPRGAGGVLAEEASFAGLQPTVPGENVNDAVELNGTLADCMRLNLEMRTANRVFFRLCTFSAADPEALYRQVLEFPWEEYLTPASPLSVHGFVRNPTIKDSRFANLKVKDAIADRFRSRFGRRPDSGPERTGFVVFLHWDQSRVQLYIDTSGQTLARHGYRKIPLDAPLQESLAAALVQSTGWDRRLPFVNPMCGSGTLAIEAALLAAGTAPGLLRGNFGFMHVVGFSRRRWEAMRSEAEARRRAETRPAGPIMATDIREEAVAAARKNARIAGVESRIAFSVCDFRESRLPEPPGVVVLNPPYGERLGDESALADLYPAIGDFFKQRCAGYRGFVLTGNPALAKRIGLRACSRKVFFNGPIECRLLEYELYEGTRRRPVPDGSEPKVPGRRVAHSKRGG
jgi:putative N6-adenine-specific DNA methylase